MGILRTKTIEPATGSTLTLGASGDTVTVSSDSIKANTFKDAGGNTLFTSDGAGTLSSVNSGLAAGGPILISTATVTSATTLIASYTSGGVSAHEIQSGIDSTYDEYMIVFVDYNPATDAAEFQFQASIDGGSNYNIAMTTTFFKAHNYEVAGDDDVDYHNSHDQSQGTSYQTLAYDVGSDADQSVAGILHLYNPASTIYMKHFHSRMSNAYSSDIIMDVFVSGYFNTTSAINALQFKFSSGAHDGHYRMYGIK